ncbi:MAG TPA: DnaD domain protein [Dehalococcoidia bacterium]|nr:DnaD domain protein [Dehalococcoidia bacterium]
MTSQGQGSPFAGFPPGSLATAIPNPFFTQVLPAIERVEELLVSVYFFFAQARKRGGPRALAEAELVSDPLLLEAMGRFRADAAEGVREGLALAVQRGTLLQAQDSEGGLHYALNTPYHRRTLRTLRPAPVLPGGGPAGNIFRLYEDNIGTVTPLIAEELRQAEERYPWSWIEAAFREAVELNKRNWRYIKAILRRWEVEGPSHEAPGRGSEVSWLEERYRRGKRRRPYSSYL